MYNARNGLKAKRKSIFIVLPSYVTHNGKKDLLILKVALFGLTKMSQQVLEEFSTSS